MYVEGCNWDIHLIELNSSISQLTMKNGAIDDRSKNSVLVHSLPESLSVISTVAVARLDMNIESPDDLVRDETYRKNNSPNPQGKNGYLSR